MLKFLMDNENKPKIDILEAIQARYRSHDLRRGSDKFRKIDPAPKGGPDYRLNALRNEDERLRQSFEQAVGLTPEEVVEVAATKDILISNP